VSPASLERAYASPTEVSVSPKEEPKSLVVASISPEEVPTSMVVAFASPAKASVSLVVTSVSLVSPLCRVGEASFSMAIDSISPVGAYASPATEEARVKTDRNLALAKGLI
jgi:hypothetical protein